MPRHVTVSDNPTVDTFGDLPTTLNFDGRQVTVRDASGDPDVAAAVVAQYSYDLTNTSWIRTSPPAWASGTWP